jgi:hypothetical protein
MKHMSDLMVDMVRQRANHEAREYFASQSWFVDLGPDIGRAVHRAWVNGFMKAWAMSPELEDFLTMAEEEAR